MSDPIVKVDRVGKIYTPSPPWMRILLKSAVAEPVVALDSVSLNVAPGEICAVVGPNGAGKSTLFRVLTGLTTPSSGHATILGLDVTEKSHDVRSLVGFMPSEERTLLLRQTCRENLAFHGRLQGVHERGLRRKVDETLDLVGLAEARDRIGFALSSGMRARLMLARAILHEPSVLILDEPTGSVDPIGSYELLTIIQRLTDDRGLAVLLSSHRLDEIETLHHNVLLLNRGRVVYWGDLDSLRETWDRPAVEIKFDMQSMAAGAARLLAGVQGIEVAWRDDTSLLVSSDVSVGQLLTVLDGQLTGITSIRPSHIPLQELLVKMLRRHSKEADNT